MRTTDLIVTLIKPSAKAFGFCPPHMELVWWQAFVLFYWGGQS